MSSATQTSTDSNTAAQIECVNCRVRLPLRLSVDGESGAVWFCSKCKSPFVGICVESSLTENADKVLLEDRYFDVSKQPQIGLAERREVVSLVHHVPSSLTVDRRRSERVAHSLIQPAVLMGEGFVPEGPAFRVIVVNLSREGIGLIHRESLDRQFFAIELSPPGRHPIQVIVRVVRQRRLNEDFIEVGGEFLVRLGHTESN